MFGAAQLGPNRGDHDQVTQLNTMGIILEGDDPGCCDFGSYGLDGMSFQDTGYDHFPSCEAGNVHHSNPPSGQSKQRDKVKQKRAPRGAADATKDADGLQGSRNQTGYIGVRMRKWGMYASEIRDGDKRRWLGTFPSGREAGMAYDAAAISQKGAKAKTNFRYLDYTSIPRDIATTEQEVKWELLPKEVLEYFPIPSNLDSNGATWHGMNPLMAMEGSTSCVRPSLGGQRGQHGARASTSGGPPHSRRSTGGSVNHRSYRTTTHSVDSCGTDDGEDGEGTHSRKRSRSSGGGASVDTAYTQHRDNHLVLPPSSSLADPHIRTGCVGGLDQESHARGQAFHRMSSHVGPVHGERYAAEAACNPSNRAGCGGTLGGDERALDLFPKYPGRPDLSMSSSGISEGFLKAVSEGTVKARQAEPDGDYTRVQGTEKAKHEAYVKTHEDYLQLCKYAKCNPTNAVAACSSYEEPQRMYAHPHHPDVHHLSHDEPQHTYAHHHHHHPDEHLPSHVYDARVDGDACAEGHFEMLEADGGAYVKGSRDGGYVEVVHVAGEEDPYLMSPMDQCYPDLDQGFPGGEYTGMEYPGGEYPAMEYADVKYKGPAMEYIMDSPDGYQLMHELSPTTFHQHPQTEPSYYPHDAIHLPADAHATAWIPGGMPRGGAYPTPLKRYKYDSLDPEPAHVDPYSEQVQCHLQALAQGLDSPLVAWHGAGGAIGTPDGSEGETAAEEAKLMAVRWKEMTRQRSRQEDHRGGATLDEVLHVLSRADALPPV